MVVADLVVAGVPKMVWKVEIFNRLKIALESIYVVYFDVGGGGKPTHVYP